MEQLRVSELAERLSKTLKKFFPVRLKVLGEVSGLFKSGAGHLYFTLKDEQASIKCVVFSRNMGREFFVPKDGDKVEAECELRAYEAESSVQLYVYNITYSAEGELLKEFERMKRKLEAEGLFESARKRQLPLYPRRVALLTASQGAAVKDFIVTAKNAGLFFNIDLWSIPVQRVEQAEEIASVIERVGKFSSRYDALVLTRGGGSLEDLAVFNTERVARALASSPIPTVSAIGHERDFTICDFVSDERAATPTAAAERLSLPFRRAAQFVGTVSERITNRLRWNFENVSLYFDKLYSKITAVLKGTEGTAFQIDAARNRVLSSFRAYALEKGRELADKSRYFERFSPAKILAATRGEGEALKLRLINAALDTLKGLSHRTDILSERVRLMDPTTLLERGYAIVTRRGTVLESISTVSLNEEIDIKLKDGVLQAFITGKKSVASGR